MLRSLFLVLVLLAAAVVLMVHADTVTSSNNNNQKNIMEMDDDAEPLLSSFAQEEGGKKTKKPVNACWREAQGRGAGKLPDKSTKECPKEYPEKNAGLCYPHCPKNMHGVGPVCWDDCEKQASFKSSGLVFCCVDDDTCSALITELGVKIPKEIVKFALDIAVNPSNILAILKDFKALVNDALDLDFPTCTAPSFVSAITSQQGHVAQLIQVENM